MKSFDVVTNSLLRIELIKVVSTEIVIRGVAKHVIDDHQQAVLDRANGALFSTSPGQTMVLGFKIAVFATHRRVRHFGEHGIEMTIGRRGFSAFALAGAFLIARTLPRPGGKVLMGGESTHVDPGFRQKRSGPALCDSDNGVKLLDCGTKRGGRDRPQPIADFDDLFFEKVILLKQLAQQKAVMIREFSFQSALELGIFSRSFFCASSAKTLASFSPAKRASILFRPEAPNTSLATEPSLMLAVSNTFWMRFSTAFRCCTSLLC